MCSGSLIYKNSYLNTDYTKRITKPYGGYYIYDDILVHSCWKNAPLGFSVFYYEGADTEEYDIPIPYCIVFVFNWTGFRSVAFAISWFDSNANLWTNAFHADVNDNKWYGWVEK